MGMPFLGYRAITEALATCCQLILLLLTPQDTKASAWMSKRRLVRVAVGRKPPHLHSVGIPLGRAVLPWELLRREKKRNDGEWT